MASDQHPTTPEPGSRIWRFLVYNAAATSIGAIIFAVTFETPAVAVGLTLTALACGFALILHEMLHLLGSDEDRLPHLDHAPVAADLAVDGSEIAAPRLAQPIAH